MTRQRIVLGICGGSCFSHLLALGILLFSQAAYAQDAPSLPDAGRPIELQSPGKLPNDGTPPADLKAPSQEVITHGSTGGQFPWAPSNPFEPDFEDYLNPSAIALRFGWWGVNNAGNPWVPGQWQSIDSSPFWDIDGLWTNGTRTFNYTAMGTDNESTKAKVQYFGPNSQGFFYFNRFPHAEEHQNFNNMAASAKVPGSGPGSGQPIIAQDLNVGQNYAIRVEQYEAQYKLNLLGQPGKDSPWLTGKINIWDQREFGDRQANDTVHCFAARAGSGQQKSCHILSQRQGIDWNTFEVTPTFEGQFGNVNIQYSHTLRVFSANDQTVLGIYTDGGANILNGVFPYAVVPSTVFNMDKIKMAVNLNEHNHLYAFGYFSEIENSEAAVSRQQGGVDLRWTNTAFRGLNFTSYFKNDNQSGNKPTVLVSPDQRQGLTQTQQAAELFQIPNQIGFNRYTAGERFNWRPWTGEFDSLLSRLSFTGGYEFDELLRSNENWYFPSLSAKPPTFALSPTTPVFHQPNTTSNSFNIAVQVPWVEGVHTYVRYKLKLIHEDLLGYTPLNFGVNSNLPDTENIIEFGGEWFPSMNFGLAFNQSFNLASRAGAPQPTAPDPVLIADSPGDILNFRENSYQTSLVIWYQPTEKLTLSGNSDYFTNQIKQNITIGDDSDDSFSGSGKNFISFAPFTSAWTYGGTAVEFGGGITYQFNCRLRFTADYEITFGKDLITSGGLLVASGSPVVNTFIPLNGYSAVKNVMQQAWAGVDYKLRQGAAAYVRYQYVAFEDLIDHSNSGSLNMLLGGLSIRW